MSNPAEVWKREKHGFDVWPEIERHAAAGTPMKDIDPADLERMKWHGFFYRKRDQPGRYMNRIRVTAGELTSAQAREIAYLAYEFGHGIVDVTTRANVQVQGLEIKHLPAVAQRLAAVGLTAKQTGHDNIRNVFAHPFSGLTPDELYDTRELCRRITELFLDSREYADLPRKFNICLNGAERHSAHFWTQDLSLLAARDADGEIAFRVLIGGTQGQNPRLAWHLPVLVRPAQAVDVTRALLDLFRARGSREKRNTARFRFLIEEIGVGGVLDWLAERLPYRLAPCIEPPPSAVSHDDLVGWFRQRNPRLWTMGLCVPLGRLSWRQLEGLAVLAKKWGDGQLRTTHEQGIAVVNIPTDCKDAAATDAAALGLSVYADSLDRNTIACTGTQFCNIAVTETKGHMLRLMERLRQRQVKLEGIRIHMSGCPSSCAQHFTADIGLKGVRVRRLLGSREGFDVFLGGGLAGSVQLGLPYKLGVDVDQLPTLIEEVVAEYYLKHQPGQTFSSYWRERLDAAAADKADEADYRPPVWVCEQCDHHHPGIDPPVFCPSCAGLRRYFARVDDNDTAESITSPAESKTTAPPAARTDGFVDVAAAADIAEGAGVAVDVGGQEVALFRIGGQVQAIDALCPHEGAPLVQGEVVDGAVVCPWHGWSFNPCTGCSLEPQGHDLARYDVREESDRVLVRVGPAAATAAAASPAASPVSTAVRMAAPVEVTLPVLAVLDEAPDVRTFRLDNRRRELPLDLPGRFVKLAADIDGETVWRSFTISSSPSQPESVDLTIKRQPGGVLTNWLFDTVRPGGSLRIKGPQGGFVWNPARQGEPLLLVSAGSGATPMMSIARYWQALCSDTPCVFVHGARRPEDILFRDECARLARERPEFRYVVALSQPDAAWQGAVGRIDASWLAATVDRLAEHRCYVCGPNEMMDSLRAALRASGVPAERIHTEQFHKSKLATVG